ncbi:MAG: peptide-methionine (S)-S-oxide reductase MsrA [Acidimicrobiales bacterium]
MRRSTMPGAGEALPGREQPVPVPAAHLVIGNPLVPPFPEAMGRAGFAMGCFWGAERLFWEMEGVWTTAAGYSGGTTPNPTYEEVCSGLTGHCEAVLVVHDPSAVTFEQLLEAFFENHDPTQGMRQGNDIGTQYRSAVYCSTPEQQELARAVRSRYGSALADAGLGAITTEVAPAGPFYYAEAYHQQYLAKNPSGYCGLAGTGVTCPGGERGVDGAGGGGRDDQRIVAR